MWNSFFFSFFFGTRASVRRLRLGLFALATPTFPEPHVFGEGETKTATARLGGGVLNKKGKNRTIKVRADSLSVNQDADFGVPDVPGAEELLQIKLLRSREPSNNKSCKCYTSF